jgi:hypothetical protein
MRVWELALALVVSAAFIVGATGPHAHAASSIELPASIDTHGDRDVTDDLNRFFASVPSDTTVELPMHAVLRVEGVVMLTGMRNVTIDGNGAQFIARTDGAATPPPARGYRPHWPRKREHVTIRSSTGVTLRDLTIVGANADGHYDPAFEGQAGIAVYASQRVVLERVSIHQTFGDGVYLAGGATDVAIRESDIGVIGRQGIAIVNAANVVVDSGRFDRIARSVIDVEPAVPKWSVASVRVTGNEVGEYGNFLLAAGGAGPNVNDIHLERNVVMGGNGLAVFAGVPRWRRRALFIVDNRSNVRASPVQATGRGGIMQLAAIDGVEIVGNREPIAEDAAAVTLASVCNVSMGGNDFPGARVEQLVTAKCGAVIGSDPSARSRDRGGANGRSEPTPGAASRHETAVRPADTDDGWIVVGAALGVFVTAVLVALTLRARRTARTSTRTRGART